MAVENMRKDSYRGLRLGQGLLQAQSGVCMPGLGEIADTLT